MPPRPPHDRHVPSSAIASFIDAPRIEALLAPWIPDGESRAFIVRCMLGEGPAHHRGANFVLLRLLGLLLERVPSPKGQAAPALAGGIHPVPMRLPPHLAKGREPQKYPLSLPRRPLEQLAGADPRAVEAMVDCLTDGPPQHALANVAMVTLIGELLARLEPEAEPER